MANAILVHFYNEYRQNRDVNRFIERMSGRYNEGTLQRLLTSPSARARQAALAALAVIGTMESNAAVAARLKDESAQVRQLAQHALWTLWLRADSPENNQELERLATLIKEEDYEKAITGLNALVAKAPKFAEAYNQRGILLWRMGDYKRSLRDCERVLKLNPCHFGALAGMAQCYLHMKKPAEALRAFRQAHRINPGLDEVNDNIVALEALLREQRRE